MLQNDLPWVLQKCPAPRNDGRMGAFEIGVRLQSTSAPGRPGRADVKIRDERSGSVMAELSYWIDPPNSQLRLFAVRLEVEADAGSESGEPERLTPGVLRDLPYARWDRMAQGSVVRSLARAHESDEAADAVGGEGGAVWSGDGSIREARTTRVTAPEEDADERRKRAEEKVRRLYPDLDPEANKFSTRTWNSLVRYADVSSEHLELLIRGVADPVGVLAQRHEVAPATVRSWLHRARESGVSSEMPEPSAAPDTSTSTGRFLGSRGTSGRGTNRRSRYQEVILEIQLADARRLLAAGHANTLERELEALEGRLRKEGNISGAEGLRLKELVRSITTLRDDEMAWGLLIEQQLREVASIRKRLSFVTKARVYVPQWVERELEKLD